MKIEDLRHQYPGEWILLAVEKKDGLGVPVEGRLVAHSQDADALWGEIAERQGQFYVFYAGEILEEMAVILYANSNCQRFFRENAFGGVRPTQSSTLTPAKAAPLRALRLAFLT